MQDDLTKARSEVWKKLWKLSIPPKVTNFMWRTLWGVLPTADALRSRMVQMDPTCPVCLQERESIHHLFLRCRLAKECWILTPLPIPGVHDSKTLWICRIFQSCSQDLACLVVMLCSVLWTNRNNTVWKNLKWSSGQILKIVVRSLSQWNDSKHIKVQSVTTAKSISRSHLKIEASKAIFLLPKVIF